MKSLIFKANEEIAMDDMFFQGAFKRVETAHLNIEKAIDLECHSVCSLFLNMNDEYARERSSDIANVCKELIDILVGGLTEKENNSNTDSYIVIADDLSPADTVRLDKKYVKGFITEHGGKTSHSVILAKTLGIPAIVGASDIIHEMEQYQQGVELYMNGFTGKIMVNPDQKFIVMAEEEIRKKKQKDKEYEKASQNDARTLDGAKVEICMNSGDRESMDAFDPSVCDGIGLFRTEFLYMACKNYPTEEDQFKVYKEIAQKGCNKSVMIRTLDIGGDKQLDYMDLPKEMNPFLGYRAIRLCLDRKDVFKTQLKAILRASEYGQIKIMFPMIVTLNEFREAKNLVLEQMRQLDADGISFDKDIKIGVMIETPGAVLIADLLAKEADFFSIGTNDLIQYTTATDRMNNRVQYLYSQYNPSVLRAIQIVAKAAHDNQIPVGICGEAASDETLLPFWLALRIDELSMVSGRIAQTKYRVQNSSREKCMRILPEIMNSGTPEEVEKILTENFML